MRSFKPDNNETHDMTVIQDANGVAHLARTYYATTSYYLPEPVMQPMWESVKFRNGTCNYGLNYHRAFYHEGYDDNDDICNQRLRKEDKPYEYVKPSRECMEQPDFLPKLSADQIGSIPPHMFNRKDIDDSSVFLLRFPLVFLGTFNTLRLDPGRESGQKRRSGAVQGRSKMVTN